VTPARAATALAVTLLLPLAGCGSSGPAALPHDATFRACLKAAKVDADRLGDAAARRKAFTLGEPLACVLGLRSAEDRHDVLGGVFRNDSFAQVAPLTAWIDTQQGRDGAAIAKDAGTLLQATNDPKPDHGDAAVTWFQVHDIVENQVALADYLHVDGTPPDYAGYLAARTDDPAAKSRYFQHRMDEGGPVADRLSEYADIIHTTGRDLRHG
jgi:predicted small lipoprotein YifL